jgi:hypothetical protein
MCKYRFTGQTFSETLKPVLESGIVYHNIMIVFREVCCHEGRPRGAAHSECYVKVSKRQSVHLEKCLENILKII